MKIMKFGGSSVADGKLIKSVAEVAIEAQKTEKAGIVLSAMRGNTDLLIQAARRAEQGDPRYKDNLQDLSRKKAEAAEFLFQDKAVKEKVFSGISDFFEDLSGILHGIDLVRECSGRSMDLVMSFGERMNCFLMDCYLNSIGQESYLVDTRGIIITDGNHGSARVNFEESYKNLKERIGPCPGIPVITGFIASTKDGITTTLGRNGSDYTAAITGAALNCSSIEIWTDVDGILSADPKLVKNAFVVPEISFQEAMELSYFGAKVIHPYTMIPAVEKDIPVIIKNTLNPSAPGTRISRTIQPHNRVITGIASIPEAAIVNIQGGGMMGVPGTASKVFSALAGGGINIIMISQASSEHSICLVLREKEAEKAAELLRGALGQELSGKMIQEVQVITGLEIIAVIGENMRGRPGLAGKVFSSLGEIGINVLAIAQGSSELNISFVIRSSDTKRAVTGIHTAFLNHKE